MIFPFVCWGYPITYSLYVREGWNFGSSIYEWFKGGDWSRIIFRECKHHNQIYLCIVFIIFHKYLLSPPLHTHNSILIVLVFDCVKGVDPLDRSTSVSYLRFMLIILFPIISCQKYLRKVSCCCNWWDYMLLPIVHHKHMIIHKTYT